MNKQDFSVIAGDDYDLDITVYDRTGTKMYMDGYTMEFSFNGMLKTSMGVITLSSIDTQTLSGKYPYSCKLVDTTGKKSTVLKGYIIVE
jgi:hypothetical protein